MQSFVSSVSKILALHFGKKVSRIPYGLVAHTAALALCHHMAIQNSIRMCVLLITSRQLNVLPAFQLTMAPPPYTAGQ